MNTGKMNNSLLQQFQRHCTIDITDGVSQGVFSGKLTISPVEFGHMVLVEYACNIEETTILKIVSQKKNTRANAITSLSALTR